MAYWIHLRCFQTFVAMRILFLDQAMNWWFVDRYRRCSLPIGIVGTRFIFLRTGKLLKNWRGFFYCYSNGSVIYNALSTQSPWFFWLSYELPCGNIQNLDAPSRFCMYFNLFHGNHFQRHPFVCQLKPSSCVPLSWETMKRPSKDQ